MEEKNEMMEMTTKVNEENTEATEESKTGLGLGAGLAIGSLLTMAAIAGVKKGKKAWANHKAKKVAKKEAAAVEVTVDVDKDFEEENVADEN